MFDITSDEWLLGANGERPGIEGRGLSSLDQYNRTNQSEIYTPTIGHDELLYRQVYHQHHVQSLPTLLTNTTSFNTSDTNFVDSSHIGSVNGSSSSGINGISDDQPTILDFAENIGDILVFYYTPTIVFVGIIGNILSVLVFFRTKLRKLSSSYYLAALGISDSGFLILCFMNWLNFADLNLINRDVICQLYSFMQGVCSFLSVWYVVAFTVERFIAVLYPLKRQSMCTVRRAVIVLCCLTVSGCIFSVPLIYFFSPVYHESNNATVCDVVEEYKVSLVAFSIFLN